MTVQKRPRPAPEPENFTIEGSEIPPHLAEEWTQFLQEQEPVEGPPLSYVDEEVDKQEPTQADSAADYRLEVLGRAAVAVTQDRNADYGEPEQSFEMIASLWNAYLRTDYLMAHDVAVMLSLLKIARLAANPLHEDSYIDLAGYAACGASIAKRMRDELDDDAARDL